MFLSIRELVYRLEIVEKSTAQRIGRKGKKQLLDSGTTMAGTKGELGTEDLDWDR